MNICLLLALLVVVKIQAVVYPGYFKLSDTKCSDRNETKTYTTDEIAIEECSQNDKCHGVTSKCTGWASCFMHCTTLSLEESNGHNFVYKKEGLSLCDNIRPSNFDEEVTDKICYDSSNMTICEVHVEKGHINGTEINTCTKYCSAYGLRCFKAFEDEDECEKDMDTPIECGAEFTEDSICSCAKKEQKATATTSDDPEPIIGGGQTPPTVIPESSQINIISDDTTNEASGDNQEQMSTISTQEPSTVFPLQTPTDGVANPANSDDDDDDGEDNENDVDRDDNGYEESDDDGSTNNGGSDSILMFVGIGFGFLAVITLGAGIRIKKSKSSSSAGNMNNIDDETTQLRAVEMGLRAENENKPTFEVNEATKDTETDNTLADPRKNEVASNGEQNLLAGEHVSIGLQKTPAREMESLSGDAKEAVFDVNEETKNATVVGSTENPYYGGL